MDIPLHGPPPDRPGAPDARLRASEARLRIAQEAARLGVFEWDVQSDRAIWENDRMYQIFGHRREDGTLSRAEFLEVVHPDDRQEFLEVMEAARGSDDLINVTVRIRPRNADAWRWIECSGRFERGADGRRTRLIGVVSDVTERRVAEHSLAESRERLALMLEAGRLGTFEWQVREGRVLWSRTLEQIHGYEPGAFAGTAEAYFAEIHPEDRVRVGRLIQDALEGRREHQMEYRIVRPDGTVRWVEGRGRVFRDSSGQPLRLLGVCTDITARVQAEEAASASQRLEAMGQLAAGMAHDTNNMMAGVLGLAHLLQRAPDLPDRLRHDVQEIIRAAEQTSHLTRQLLTFSRRQIVSPEAVDLVDAVRENEDMLRRVLGADVLLDFDLPGVPCWITIDRTQLVQVLLNLALNARDAMASGGSLRIAVEAGGRGPVLEVADSGVGMEDAVRVRIFEPFFTTKPHGQGTGLGLSTVHGIVTQGGGTVDVRSRPGAGTAFRLSFPAAVAPPSPVSSREDHAVLGQGGTILVVDDEPLVRDLVRRMLEDQGFAVEVAPAGGHALEVAERTRIDALITDLTMPGMSGTELARRILDRRPELPVLFMTGHHGNDIRWDGARPAPAVLHKPFSPEALYEALDRAITRAAGSATRRPGAVA